MCKGEDQLFKKDLMNFLGEITLTDGKPSEESIWKCLSEVMRKSAIFFGGFVWLSEWTPGSSLLFPILQ